MVTPLLTQDKISSTKTLRVQTPSREKLEFNREYRRLLADQFTQYFSFRNLADTIRL
jgi:hypothetical protein